MTSRTWIHLFLLLAAVGVVQGATSVPKKIGGNGPIDRPTNHPGFWCFDQWELCASPVDSFVADGDSATVVFRVRNYQAGSPGLGVEYRLDNVIVLERAVYDVSLGSLAQYQFNPYNCAWPATGQDALDFAPLLAGGVPYFTNFDGAIGPEWSYDPAQVSYHQVFGEEMFDDPFDPQTQSSTGSMEIGTGNGPEFNEVTLQLTGLTEGTQYVLSYWSRSFNDPLECVDEGFDDDWEVEIFGEDDLCAPDLPQIDFLEVRTMEWEPTLRDWTFQVRFVNSGGGVASGIEAHLNAVSPQVTVVDGDAWVGDLDLVGHGSTAWGGDTFKLNLFGHNGPATLDVRYSFVDDCGGAGLTSEITILADPTTYPTAIAPTLRGPTLAANVPNPFNPSTMISFTLAEAGEVDLMVFDVRGRRVRSLLAGTHQAGAHHVRWDATDDAGQSVAAGTYFVRLLAGDRTLARPMTLIE